MKKGRWYLKIREGVDLLDALKAMKMGEAMAKYGWKKLARNAVDSGMDKKMFNKGHTRWGNKRIRRKKAFRQLQFMFLDELFKYWEKIEGVPPIEGTFDVLDQAYNQLTQQQEENTNEPSTSTGRDPGSTTGT